MFSTFVTTDDQAGGRRSERIVAESRLLSIPDRIYAHSAPHPGSGRFPARTPVRASPYFGGYSPSLPPRGSGLPGDRLSSGFTTRRRREGNMFDSTASVWTIADVYQRFAR